MHIEVSDKYFALIDGGITVSFHKVASGYVLMDNDTLNAPVTVHQMHVLADWLMTQVKGELEE